MKLRLLLCLLLSAGMWSCRQGPLTVESPDGNVKLEVYEVDHRLKYSLRWQGEYLITAADLSLFPEIRILGAKVNRHDSEWKTVWGQFDTIRNHYSELIVDVEWKGAKGKLLARSYNDGIAFRFVLPEGEKSGTATFKCTYPLPAESQLYVPAGESEPWGPLSLAGLRHKLKERKSRKNLSIPLVVETPGKSFMAVLESDLYSATAGFQVMKLEIDSANAEVFSANEVTLSNRELVTPWRVILLGNTAGDLLTSTTTVNLAAPCKLDDTGWIKPGKTLWDWRVHGYTAPDGFTYGINTESYKRFIDFAAAYGIDYFLIDDAWYTHVTKGHFELSDKLNLQEVIDYAESKEVNLMLYYDRRHGQYGDDELFPYYSSLNMKGIKYGFMGKNVPFTRSAIEKSAESRLLIDFHDGPVPFTGVRRTLPNAVTREYCHAQQDSRRAFTPESFLKMALINAITGPLDMNNGNFDIRGINSGKRLKGPRKLNSYLTTVTSEAARTLIIFSGLVCIPDAPEAYAAKKDLFEFIQKQPVGKWNDTKILHSKIGAYITTARRAGNEWFIGSVISQKGGKLDIRLDFLDEGLVYEATLYEDTEETHCATNPEAYRVRKISVKKGDRVTAEMAPGGGHCMWLKPRP
ncbi:MAG: glycoside hydrolase family 97 protein [Cytophagales bacterium]|nr:glycoside hydrolase family 97 protein [Cytophagales bacterium]